MREYAAIVGVYWQKCGFLPDRAYCRFKATKLGCVTVKPMPTNRRPAMCPR